MCALQSGVWKCPISHVVWFNICWRCVIWRHDRVQVMFVWSPLYGEINIWLGCVCWSWLREPKQGCRCWILRHPPPDLHDSHMIEMQDRKWTYSVAIFSSACHMLYSYLLYIYGFRWPDRFRATGPKIRCQTMYLIVFFCIVCYRGWQSVTQKILSQA